MPANLPPDYHSAEARYRAAKTPAEKIAALEEMLRIMPKHKGTDRLQGDLKSKIAKLRREPPKKGTRRVASHAVHPEGAGQVVLVGTANTGKSSLVASLTHARPEVADYPFTTREPTPGMMRFENILIQLVDLPPLTGEHAEPWLFDLIRQADLVWLVTSGSDTLSQVDEVERLLAERRIRLLRRPSDPRGEPGWSSVRALLVVTGLDRRGVRDDLAVLPELIGPDWRTVAVSSATGEGLDELARGTFEALDIVRVHTKQPGKPPDTGSPFTLPRGSTVEDLAAKIHKEIAERLRFARIWGRGVFDGQTVQRDHVLEEGDIVELHE